MKKKTLGSPLTNYTYIYIFKIKTNVKDQKAIWSVLQFRATITECYELGVYFFFFHEKTAMNSENSMVSIQNKPNTKLI